MLKIDINRSGMWVTRFPGNEFGPISLQINQLMWVKCTEIAFQGSTIPSHKASILQPETPNPRAIITTNLAKGR